MKKLMIVMVSALICGVILKSCGTKSVVSQDEEGGTSKLSEAISRTNSE